MASMVSLPPLAAAKYKGKLVEARPRRVPGDAELATVFPLAERGTSEASGPSVAGEHLRVGVSPACEPGPGRLGDVEDRIMYVELKSGFNDNGPAWIGRVRFSKSGRTIYYRGRTLRRNPS